MKLSTFLFAAGAAVLIISGAVIFSADDYAYADSAVKKISGSDKKASRSFEDKNKMEQNLRAGRYSRPSTEVSYILVQIKKAGSDETAEIICDHSDWIMYSKVYPYNTKNHDEYVKFMLENDSKPFELEEAAFNKLKRFKVKPLSQDMLSLSRDEFINRFLNAEDYYGRKYFTINREAGNANEVIHFILLKGGNVKQRCIDGRLTAAVPKF